MNWSKGLILAILGGSIVGIATEVSRPVYWQWDKAQNRDGNHSANSDQLSDGAMPAISPRQQATTTVPQDVSPIVEAKDVSPVRAEPMRVNPLVSPIVEPKDISPVQAEPRHMNLLELERWLEYGNGQSQDSHPEAVAARRQAIELLSRTARSRRGSADFSSLVDAIVVAEDGQFLGKITTNQCDASSITNAVGVYGSQVSSTSMFNQVGRYGSDVSVLSPFNTVATSPPRIFKDREFVAFLTVNTIKIPRVDPNLLVAWLKANQ
jgi:hypothetical protein